MRGRIPSARLPAVGNRRNFFSVPNHANRNFTPLGHPCRLRHRWPSVYKSEAHLCCLQWLLAPPSKSVEVVHDRSLVMPEPMNGIDPVLITMDMLPGATDQRYAPGLTLGYIPLPCLSPVEIPRRCSIIVRADYTDAAWTRAVLMHSPELPQFSTVQLESIPWTVLESN